jgi:hypothetical protein
MKKLHRPGPQYYINPQENPNQERFEVTFRNMTGPLTNTVILQLDTGMLHYKM